MSTHDVPGYNEDNNDELHIGCWGEHEDGSLLLVEGMEGGKVIYSIFDLSADPPMEYRDAMPEDGFKEHFSWDERDDDDDAFKWLWKDKTTFPWDKVMATFKDGSRYPSALDQISAAQKVAKVMKIKGLKMSSDKFSHKMEVVGKKGKIIRDKIQRAIAELRA